MTRLAAKVENSHQSTPENKNAKRSTRDSDSDTKPKNQLTRDVLHLAVLVELLSLLLGQVPLLESARAGRRPSPGRLAATGPSRRRGRG